MSDLACPDHLALVVGRASQRSAQWVPVRPLRRLHELCAVCQAPACWEVG